MIREAVRVTVDPTMTQLLRDVAAGIRVLQVRDGILLSEKQILERARNIVMGLVGNYRIETLDGRETTLPGRPGRPGRSARSERTGDRGAADQRREEDEYQDPDALPGWAGPDHGR